MKIVLLTGPLKTINLNPSFSRNSQKSQNLGMKLGSHMVSMNVFSYTTSSSLKKKKEKSCLLVKGLFISFDDSKTPSF